MRRDFTYPLLIGMLLLSLGLNGCGGILVKETPQAVSERRQKLAKAVNMIETGHDSEARYFLELVIDDTGEAGVTDEALFRLAILKLNDGELGAGKSSIALLERMRSSYPTSAWTNQSTPLYSYLMNIKNIRNREREFKTLREKNLSLSRDVSELRQAIDRLKALDHELEQKIRR
ncbi:MAG: hypothetical protein WCD00_09740 [Desulfuromonadaceae bacterium]